MRPVNGVAKKKVDSGQNKLHMHIIGKKALVRNEIGQTENLGYFSPLNSNCIGFSKKK